MGSIPDKRLPDGKIIYQVINNTAMMDRFGVSLWLLIHSISKFGKKGGEESQVLELLSKSMEYAKEHQGEHRYYAWWARKVPIDIMDMLLDEKVLIKSEDRRKELIRWRIAPEWENVVTDLKAFAQEGKLRKKLPGLQ